MYYDEVSSEKSLKLSTMSYNISFVSLRNGKGPKTDTGETSTFIPLRLVGSLLKLLFVDDLQDNFLSKIRADQLSQIV